MARTKAAKDPSMSFSLLDVALWETRLKRGIEYIPLRHADHVGAQTRVAVLPERLEIEDDSGKELSLLRARVHLGVRGVFLDPGRPATDEVDSHEILFELETSYAVVYVIVREPPVEELLQFCRLNAVHNAWPFWRQHVFDTLKRASLPLVQVPLFRMDSTEPVPLLTEEPDLDIT